MAKGLKKLTFNFKAENILLDGDTFELKEVQRTKHHSLEIVPTPTKIKRYGEISVLFHDEGVKEDSTKCRSAEKHYVRFESPKQDVFLQSVKIYGLYSDQKTNKSDFRILLCDDELNVISDFSFPLRWFDSEQPDWVTLGIPPTKLPSKFVIGLTSDKALSVGVDSKNSGNSFWGSSDGDIQYYSEGDWLIQVLVK